MIGLLQHNTETYEQLCKTLESNNKCALVQATGTGKSYIAGKYIEEHAKTALILVPTNAIADAWADLLSESDHDIDIVTYQAFAKEPQAYLEYDLVIADEMHHLGSEVWGQKFVETYLQSDNHKIIGLTATEIRYLDNSRDMAEEIFGNIRVDGYDLPTAINAGVLPTFKYVSALYCDESDFDEWREKAGKIKDIKTQTELKGKLDVCIKNMVSVKQAVNENLTDDYKKIIVFLNNVESKETALEMFRDVFPTANFYDVDYSKYRTENNEQIASFKADDNRAVLFAVDMLNEGIHIKGTDCVIMFRNTISPQVYLQQLGRGLASGAERMPVIFDFVANYKGVKCDSYIQSSERVGTPIITRWNEGIQENKIITKFYIAEIQDVIKEIDIILKHFWTDSEILFLRNNVDRMTYSELAEWLGVSVAKVQQKCYQLGITSSKKRVRFYTQDEIEFIKQNYGNMELIKIANSINRTLNSVKMKVNELKLYETDIQEKKRQNERGILQLDVHSCVVGCYKSVRECVEKNNFSKVNGITLVNECLRGVRQYYHDYKFMYAGDYKKMIAESEVN